MRVLFILKKNETYGFKSYTRRSSGLFHSTSHIVESLKANGVHAHLVEVNDNNDIDREVTAFKPDKVVIEALWVVLEKFPILFALHPHVNWYVHLHSHMPFLALEGIAMDWIIRYADLGIGIIANSVESYDALRAILHKYDITYLPNVYIPDLRPAIRSDLECGPINVGCFGAIRPLKNQLLQALSAIEFAKIYKRKLRFHINASRIETGGDPVLKNLVHLFKDTEHTELVQCHWMEPEEFRSYLRHEIDIGLQVSLTETFNVVCADYVSAGLPVVGSKEIKWLSCFSKAKDDSLPSIVSKMNRAMHNPWLISWNQRRLLKHSKQAQYLWDHFARGYW